MHQFDDDMIKLIPPLDEYIKNTLPDKIDKLFTTNNIKKGIFYNLLQDNIIYSDKIAISIDTISKILRDGGDIDQFEFRTGFDISEDGSIKIAPAKTASEILPMPNSDPYKYNIINYYHEFFRKNPVINDESPDVKNITDYNLYDFMFNEELVSFKEIDISNDSYDFNPARTRKISIRLSPNYIIHFHFYEETEYCRNFISTTILASPSSSGKIKSIKTELFITKNKILTDFINKLSYEDKMILNMRGLISDKEMIQ